MRLGAHLLGLYNGSCGFAVSFRLRRSKEASTQPTAPRALLRLRLRLRRW